MFYVNTCNDFTLILRCDQYINDALLHMAGTVMTYMTSRYLMSGKRVHQVTQNVVDRQEKFFIVDIRTLLISSTSDSRVRPYM